MTSKTRPTNWVPRKQTVSPARALAYEVIQKVELEGAFANLLLPRFLKKSALSKRDVAFATELTYGVLRHQGQIDAIISKCLSSGSIDNIEASVRTVIRLGALQLIHLRVPAHAAVSESVNHARWVSSQGASKIVNAVLHRISEKPLEQWITSLCDELQDPDKVLALKFSCPSWQVKVIREALAKASNDDQLNDLLAANLTPPPLTLTVKPNLASKQELLSQAQAANMTITDCRYSPWGIHFNGNPGKLAIVRSHHVSVQDEGSQIVAGLLAYAPLLGKTDDNWLDLCAGPGGKAGLIGSIAIERGAHLVANEFYEHRVKLVAAALAPQENKYKDSTTIWCSDGQTVGNEFPASFDRILVDVPCSGLGAIRRRPESRWRKQPSDIANLRPLQRALLESAWKAVRPGGVVGYATCSPAIPETREIIHALLDKHADMEILDSREVLANFALAIPEGINDKFLTLWPHLHDTDAMFMALLRKKI